MSEMDAAVRAASAVLDVYYVKEPVGGAVHIVADDYNLRDESVVWCAEQARKDGDEEGRAMAEMLLAFPLEQRALIVNRNRCTVCGHSVCLHSDWSGTMGFSESGPCELPGCDCTDCVHPPGGV